jgi:hypothetical protein
LENIFTAIKYSGLEDSNKFLFRSYVYVQCELIYGSIKRSREGKEAGRKEKEKIDYKYKLELMHDDKNIQPRINLYFTSAFAFPRFTFNPSSHPPPPPPTFYSLQHSACEDKLLFN